MRKLYHPKTPFWLKILQPKLIWELKNQSNAVFITFDDGPVQGVTDKALDILKKYQAKSTFFCLGSNVKKNPELFNRIKEEGHCVGNHTFNHLKGWTSANSKYLQDVELADTLIKSKLFRPPFGKIGPKQAKLLQKKYDIIMWDVMSFDYDPKVSPKECTDNVIKNIEPGSIVTFHDSVSAAENMLFALEETLKYCQDKFEVGHGLSGFLKK